MDSGPRFRDAAPRFVGRCRKLSVTTSVFVYGGAMLPGRWRDQDVTILSAYEGVGAVLNGTLTEQELEQLGHACAPTLGSCPGQFTANTMAMVAEALGLALPGSAMLPAAYSQRLALARQAGRRATELVLQGASVCATRRHTRLDRSETTSPWKLPFNLRPRKFMTSLASKHNVL